VKAGKDLLFEGIETLCQNDKDIESLTAGCLEDIVSLLERYVKEIMLFNAAYGLVAVNNTEELIIKHILDSVAPLGIIHRLLENKTGAQIADAGSGAGLPGIPLAITLPNYNFTLIERMGRRAGFLHNTRAVLGLNNIIIEEGELEKTKNKRFSLITFRAFKPLKPELLKILFDAADNGIIAAYKGKREKIKQEMAQLEDSYCNWEAIPYNTPFLDEERHILIVKEHV
jgi:16S rRNA (guanine527-N7)-methyltransferase